MASVHSLWTGLLSGPVTLEVSRPFSPTTTSNSVFAFVHDHLGFPRVVLNVRCLTNKDIFAGVVTIDETVLLRDVKHLNGSEHSYSVAPQVQKAVLHLLALSCRLPMLRRRGR